MKKCSLRGLESRKDFNFFSYPTSSLPDINNYLILAVDAPPLSEKDQAHGLFVIDATWRYAARMLQHLEQHYPALEKRSLPAHYRTAYPRRQDDCPNPECGLASIEAIYLAYRLMGRPTDGLLDDYYWKTPFLELNKLP